MRTGLLRPFLFMRGRPGHPPRGSRLMLPEGATRAPAVGTSEASFEGEAPQALPAEGATRAPVIAANACLVEIQKWREQ